MLRDVGGHIRNSAKRMVGLIDDMLDFAKGRLGGGLSLDRHPDAPLHEHLEQVIGELRDVSENAIEAQITLHHPVNCDPKRIAQVASNLVANAVKHGAPDQPVLATTNEQSFELAVANQGEPIDPVVMRQLFQPFFRGRASNQGLGLGLYIASEIARAALFACTKTAARLSRNELQIELLLRRVRSPERHGEVASSESCSAHLGDSHRVGWLQAFIAAVKDTEPYRRLYRNKSGS